MYNNILLVVKNINIIYATLKSHAIVVYGRITIVHGVSKGFIIKRFNFFLIFLERKIFLEQLNVHIYFHQKE